MCFQTIAPILPYHKHKNVYCNTEQVIQAQFFHGVKIQAASTAKTLATV